MEKVLLYWSVDQYNNVQKSDRLSGKEWQVARVQKRTILCQYYFLHLDPQCNRQLKNWMTCLPALRGAKRLSFAFSLLETRGVEDIRDFSLKKKFNILWDIVTGNWIS